MLCYLGDMLCTGGELEVSSTTQIRAGWKKFKEILPLLTLRVYSHKMKGNIHKACVMFYGSEIWAVKMEDTY